MSLLSLLSLGTLMISHKKKPDYPHGQSDTTFYTIYAYHAEDDCECEAADSVATEEENAAEHEQC